MNWCHKQLSVDYNTYPKQAHRATVLFAFVSLSLRKTERRKQDGQSKRQLYPQMLMKNILIHMFPFTCLFPGNLALQHKKKKKLRCFHTNKPISNHHTFLLWVAYRWILVMI